MTRFLPYPTPHLSPFSLLIRRSWVKIPRQRKTSHQNNYEKINRRKNCFFLLAEHRSRWWIFYHRRPLGLGGQGPGLRGRRHPRQPHERPSTKATFQVTVSIQFRLNYSLTLRYFGISEVSLGRAVITFHIGIIIKLKRLGAGVNLGSFTVLVNFLSSKTAEIIYIWAHQKIR